MTNITHFLLYLGSMWNLDFFKRQENRRGIIWVEEAEKEEEEDRRG
jgi:hypothetical protein